MGLAYDTVGFTLANPGATFAAAAALSGDSLTVRSFPPTGHAYLLRAVRQGVTEGGVRILSPSLHDNVRGITVLTNETPEVFTFPREVKQELRPADTLAVQLTGGTGETDGGSLVIYYTDVPGLQARLFSPADILPRIKSIKPLEVDVTPTANVWLDTVITTTEDLLHANTDYAVLGYTIDNPIIAVGIKGTDTSNLRVCGPGSISSIVTADFFWEMSLRENLPCIPVFNSANKGGTFLSTYGVPSVASKVILNLAELAA